MASRDTIKAWFETGDKPTKAQFWELFDSIFFKDEDIDAEDIEGLDELLSNKVDKTAFDAYEQGQIIVYNGDATYVIPGGYLLEDIIPFYGNAGTMKLSLVQQGDEDVMPEMNIVEGWNQPISVKFLALENTSLYINGIPNGSKIVFLKRKIKLA